MTKRILFVVALVIAVIAGILGWKEYNRKATNANEMPVAETITAEALLGAFQADEAAGTARFVGTTEQVIQVNGRIRAIGPAGPELANVTLETSDDLSGVVCEFSSKDVPPTWKSGDAVSIKGVCTGMLMDVVLVRCQAVE